MELQLPSPSNQQRLLPLVKQLFEKDIFKSSGAVIQGLQNYLINFITTKKTALLKIDSDIKTFLSISMTLLLMLFPSL